MFRQKIFFIYVLVFLLFLALMTPIASFVVRMVVNKAMESRGNEIIKKIQLAENNQALVLQLKQMRPTTFFRMSVITNEHVLLYDSHSKRILGLNYPNDKMHHPEVIEAFKKGIGHSEGYSQLLLQEFAYTALRFDFHGKPYVLRIAFPNQYIRELIDDFELGFFLLASLILILFSLMTWLLINNLTKPIQDVITAVGAYNENIESSLSSLRALTLRQNKEDVGKLASTLVSLSDKLQSQITTLKDERNEKEVLLESLVEGVIAIDSNHLITFANFSALKFLGLEKTDLLGISFKEIAPKSANEQLLCCQKENRPIADTLKLENNNQIFYLDTIAAPKKDDTGAILIMVDKSDQHKILEMRKDFIANASHELKTPITIIRGFAETIHDHPDLDPVTMHEITKKIVTNCDRMATLVRDLLALADIENIPSSRIHFYDLNDQVKLVIQTASQVFKDAKITLINKSSEPLILEADSDLMEMALINLISNSAKYSTPNANITVTLSTDDSFILIEIKDTGIGIAKHDLPHIFERFYRVDKAHSRKVGGSGLGLSIVETVVKKHFGSINVESELGQGSTFTLKIPIRHY